MSVENNTSSSNLPEIFPDEVEKRERRLGMDKIFLSELIEEDIEFLDFNFGFYGFVYKNKLWYGRCFDDGHSKGKFFVKNYLIRKQTCDSFDTLCALMVSLISCTLLQNI